ncbi:clathrin interactor EPSIN 2 [Lactuca sativa]|uniref:ENTH domain-containing protein n=1 Tax=Lactuca sativa TaxID=4236 RepID=A0A9R1WKL3_LACSA|nr:clathrin interactor EPSIN 2 [Lactuca sativa]KAJ0226985.1 hypothetical protein LSAT_V11C100027720 [Lactuca sativa]
MKKAFDQTVRDIKRGVNKKVLKVPSIEQKVLDATSNETWGPHGSLLADIALASRNYHEYQMIMSIIWKRVNDTGKNWRHVYKGLTVLEYLVANGSERVIDEIKEHSYQITTLSEFQYIDHTGRDQGNNVRKKSQSLVALVNDKEKLQEVREKAAANWDKFHKTSGSAKYRPGSYPGAGGYEDDRYEGRYGSRDDNSNSNNGYGREREREREREWGDDEYNRGRRSFDAENYGRRSRSSDREREQRAYDDEAHYSSRGSNVKADDQSQKSPEGVPPSYEDAVANGDPKTSPPPVTTTRETVAPPPVTAAPPPPPPAATMNTENNGFDEFDPRGSFQAAAAAPPPPPPVSGGGDMDLFGDPFSLNSLAIVPVTYETSDTNSNPPSGQTFVAPSSTSTVSSQAFEDPFGDGPFRAVPSTAGFSAPPQSASAATVGQNGQPPPPPQPAAPTPNTVNNFGYGSSFDQNTDILAGLLPPSGPFQGQPLESQPHGGGQFVSHGGQTATHGGFPGQMSSGFPGSNGQPANFYGGYEPQGSSAPLPPVPPVTATPAAQSNPSSFYQQPQPQPTTLNSSTGALALVPQQPAKFETKSTVWADTLNRGLVNLNIAGSKTNPLSDIGVDFEALNRKERRMEKTNTTPMATSNVAMGKAMGSGSGIGRAGMGALRPQPNPMMGPGPGGYPNPPMGQFQMQPPTAGYASGTYNPMMGLGRGGGYGQPPPYGGGYR